jgi:hypothetical protein
VPKQGVQVKVREEPLEQLSLDGMQLAYRVSATDVVAVLVTSLKPMPAGTWPVAVALLHSGFGEDEVTTYCLVKVNDWPGETGLWEKIVPPRTGSFTVMPP